MQKYTLKCFQSLEVLNYTDDFGSAKISVLQIDHFNYGLLVYGNIVGRTSFIKLSLKDLPCINKDDFKLNNYDLGLGKNSDLNKEDLCLLVSESGIIIKFILIVIHISQCAYISSFYEMYCCN